MPPKDLPPQTAELFLTRGAVVLFGPDYLDNSLQLINEMKGALDGIAVLSCEKIDDLRLPNGPVLNCSMIFFHRRPARMDVGAWDTALLEGVNLQSQPPKGLGVADQSPEMPNVELVPVSGDEMQLIVTWLRPLASNHIVETARAIERAFLEHSGRYNPI